MEGELDAKEKDVIDKINKIYESIGSKNKNIENIINNIDNLVEESDEFKYLQCLLYPEKYRGVKIPSEIPIQSCTFQYHHSFVENCANETGFLFNPFFLYNVKQLNDLSSAHKYYYGKYGEISSEISETNTDVEYLTSLYNFGLTAYDEIEYSGVKAIDIGQNINDLYTMYRLVSACVIIKNVGEVRNANGIIGGTIINDDFRFLGGEAPRRHPEPIFEILSIIGPNMDKFADYKNFNNSIYYKQNNSSEGMKLIYFPIDNSYEEFVEIIKPSNFESIYKEDRYILGYKVGEDIRIKPDKNFKNGFNFYFHFLNNEKYNNLYKIDFYCNFECIPNPKYQDFLTLNIYYNNLNIKNKQNIISYIRSNCITQLNNYDNVLDWEMILRKLNEKRNKVGKDKLKKKKQISNMYNELKSKIDKELNKTANTINEIPVKKVKESDIQQKDMINETPMEQIKKNDVQQGDMINEALI